MDSIFKYGIGAIAILGLVVGFLAYTRQPAEPTPPVGAVAGADFPGPSMSVSNVRTFDYNSPMTKNSSTTCMFKTPTEGSSTLQFASAKIASSSSSAYVAEWGKATTIDATTTSLGVFSVGAGGQGTIVATTTVVNGLDDKDTFAPGTYLTFKTGGASLPAASAMVGSCNAEFILN